MVDHILDGAAYQWMPEDWFVVFWRKTNIPWARYLAWGQFKHVTACGYVRKANSWIFVDPRWEGVIVETIPDDMADLRIQSWARGNLVMHVGGGRLGSYPRFGWWCVPIIAHVIGSPSGALRPDAFLASLRDRAVLVSDWNADGDEDGRFSAEEGGGAVPAGSG